jgi:hypothetical protein
MKLTKEEFIKQVLDGVTAPVRAESGPIPSGTFSADDVFGPDSNTSFGAEPHDTRFAELLLEHALGPAQTVAKQAAIRSTDAVARCIPDQVSYWKKEESRGHHTILIEAEITRRELLAIPAFKNRQLAHLDIVEDALARLVAEVLDGFQRGGDGLNAAALKGDKQETLCVVSIIDERHGQTGRLVCFGTYSAETRGLETFFLTEHARSWERADARERLGLMFERQFQKLGTPNWQEAFTTTNEREQAEKLLEVCTTKQVNEAAIQESMLDLLDTIAKGFGLRKKADAQRRLRAFPLPGEHDIGIDAEERESKYGGTNPFSGVTLRDDQSRLLGYIVYPLKAKSDAEKLGQHLKKYNRFHNVLVVYPDADQASIELWQGRDQLTGKLRKGQSHKDAADVVNLLSRFFVVSKAKVRNPAELAQELAYRARYLRRLALRQLEDEPEKGPLRNLYHAFKVGLVHDQKEDEFADAFAQTITYGLLTARWLGNDQLVAGSERFTRQNALKYLPAASPFLNDLFKSALSLKLDEQRGRLLWLVDDVADLLDRIDVTHVFGAGDKDADTSTDPVIHFYEPFLAAYDKDLKDKRGVFFTPRAVVGCIVRTVHEMIKNEFGVEDGLASTDSWGDVVKRIDGLKLPEGTIATDEFIRVLDPATGTGTFLYECIGVIEQTMKDRWCRELSVDTWTHKEVVARWNDYVPKHLLPRLYGFELMMASYAICHLKLSFKLRETGYHLGRKDRLHVHLTDTLDEPSGLANPKLADLFDSLAEQAREVDTIKRSMRFTVLIGNPPYSPSVSNPAWLVRELEPWKEGLVEQKIDLNREEWKFVRYAQLLAERVPCFIWGYIVNRDFLDGIAKRRMRESLQATYPARVVVDLNGDVKGNIVDENVFDITQGVCITVACHGGRTQEHLFASIVGSREEKYALLSEPAKVAALLTPHVPSEPYFRWIPFLDADTGAMEEEYRKWSPINEVFPVYSSGIQTKNDRVCIGRTPSEMFERVRFLDETPAAQAARELGIKGGGAWSIAAAKQDLRSFGVSKKNVRRILYRPFDWRYTYYTNKSGGFLGRPRYEVMRHMAEGENLALIFNRQIVGSSVSQFGATKDLVCHGTFYLGNKGQDYLAPLYTFENDLLSRGKRERRPNLAPKFLAGLKSALGKEPKPEDVFHYLLAVFHSETYRTRYGELIKQDFPRAPLTNKKALFASLVTLGEEIASLHMMESALTQSGTSPVGMVGSEVEKADYDEATKTIWIDKRKTKGLKGVEPAVWGFCVGGYQVCEKWLNDRKGESLSKNDVEHYRLVVATLAALAKLMKGVDAVIGKHGGWPGAFATEERSS